LADKIDPTLFVDRQNPDADALEADNPVIARVTIGLQDVIFVDGEIGTFIGAAMRQADPGIGFPFCG
jgi:hypothetical protein